MRGQTWGGGEDGPELWRELGGSLSLLGWGVAVSLVPCLNFSFGSARFVPQMIVAPVLAIAGLRRLPLPSTAGDLQQLRRTLVVLAAVVLAASLLSLLPALGTIASIAAWLTSTAFLVLLGALLTRFTSMLGATELRAEWQRVTKALVVLAVVSVIEVAVPALLVAAGVLGSTNNGFDAAASPVTLVMLIVTAIVSLGLFTVVVVLLATAWSHTTRWVRRQGNRFDAGDDPGPRRDARAFPFTP